MFVSDSHSHTPVQTGWTALAASCARKIGQSRQLTFQSLPYAAIKGTRATARAAAAQSGAAPGSFVVRGPAARLVLSYVARVDDAFVRRFSACLAPGAPNADDALSRAFFGTATQLRRFVSTDVNDTAVDDEAVVLERVGEHVLVHRSIAREWRGGLSLVVHV